MHNILNIRSDWNDLPKVTRIQNTTGIRCGICKCKETKDNKMYLMVLFLKNTYPSFYCKKHSIEYFDDKRPHGTMYKIEYKESKDTVIVEKKDLIKLYENVRYVHTMHDCHERITKLDRNINNAFKLLSDLLNHNKI